MLHLRQRTLPASDCVRARGYYRIFVERPSEQPQWLVESFKSKI